MMLDIEVRAKLRDGIEPTETRPMFYSGKLISITSTADDDYFAVISDVDKFIYILSSAYYTVQSVRG